MTPPQLIPILSSHLADSTSAWSIGTQGAVAEFFRDEGERLDPADLEQLRAVTERGAIAIDLPGPVKAIAFEGLSRHRERWTHGVLFCLPRREAARAGRAVITELGPDHASLRPEYREHPRFDLGLGIAHIEVCVRSADPQLLAVLRAHVGSPLLGPDDRALAALLAHSPHRVFVSALGRIEVYQPIARAVTPDGPHTHLLPDRLNAPPSAEDNMAPAGHAIGLALYPAHPVLDQRGDPKPFDPTAHEQFQRLLEAWGAPAFAAEKRRALAALASGVDPPHYSPGDNGVALTALRVAIRQFASQHPSCDMVCTWQDAFDAPANDSMTTRPDWA